MYMYTPSAVRVTGSTPLYLAASIMRGSNAVGRIGLNGPFAGIPKTASQTSGTDPGTNAATGMPMRATTAPARRKASHLRSPRDLVKKCQAMGACLHWGDEVLEAEANRSGERAPLSGHAAVA